MVRGVNVTAGASSHHIGRPPLKTEGPQVMKTPLSLDRLRDEQGFEPAMSPSVADTTDTPVLAAIAATLTPAELEVWAAYSATTTKASAARLLGKHPSTVRVLLARVAHKAAAVVACSSVGVVNALGPLGGTSRGPVPKEASE